MTVIKFKNILLIYLFLKNIRDVNVGLVQPLCKNDVDVTMCTVSHDRPRDLGLARGNSEAVRSHTRNERECYRAAAQLVTNYSIRD
jgi:hypothetical protein